MIILFLGGMDKVLQGKIKLWTFYLQILQFIKFLPKFAQKVHLQFKAKQMNITIKISIFN